MFRGDLLGTGGSQQGVGEFLAAAGIGEPPRGGIDKGQALCTADRRASRSPRTATAAKRCPLGMARVPRGNRRSGSSPSPSTDAASSRVRDKSYSSRHKKERVHQMVNPRLFSSRAASALLSSAV